MKFLILILAAMIGSVIPTTQIKIGNTIANSCSGDAWRLVHDGTKVVASFHSKGTTQTIQSLFCATTEDEIKAEITRLNLTPLPPAKKK